jgi:SPP1 family predicted phage head-tail adaptor
MRSGGFDRKITIQKRVVTRDAANGEVESWVDFTQAWATVVGYSRKKGNEYFALDREAGESIIQFTIRWVPGITEQMRILHDDGLYYNISGIVEITRRKGLVIDAHAQPG